MFFTVLRFLRVVTETETELLLVKWIVGLEIKIDENKERGEEENDNN